MVRNGFTHNVRLRRLGFFYSLTQLRKQKKTNTKKRILLVYFLPLKLRAVQPLHTAKKKSSSLNEGERKVAIFLQNIKQRKETVFFAMSEKISLKAPLP